MKKVRKIVKKLIILYVVLYIILGSFSNCFALQNYDAACGEYVSEFARDFIETYCTPTEEKTRYAYVSHAEWSGGSFGSGTFIACCNTGVRYMFELALGIELCDYGMVNHCADDVDGLGQSEYWIDVTNETLQPGDLVISSSHVEMYIGDNQNANFGNSPYAGKIVNGPRLGSSFTKAYRLSSSVQVDPSGTVTPSRSSLSQTVDFSNFYFNGIPDGKYSVAHTSIWSKIIDTLASIADYIIGLLTYIIRMVIVGWTAIFDNLFNWTVNTVVETGTDSSDIDIDTVEVNSSDSDTRITIETLFYNGLDLTDINIFTD